MPDQEIDVAFGTSKAYAPHVAVVIASIVRRAPGAAFRFIILHEGIPAERQAMIESAAPHARYVWAQVSDDDVPPYADREHFSRPILYRLGLEKLAPADCRRVIYLDSDIILRGDIRRLWAYDLEGAPLAGVVDYLVEPAQFAARWGLPPDSTGYFNSGVLLIDLDRVRAERIFTTSIDFVARHPGELIYADQDALNHTLWGRWRPLPPTWNAQRNMVIDSMAMGLPPELRFHDRLPELVQYTGAEKPWVLGAYHPWSWLYWQDLARTPFFEEIARESGIGRLERLRLWVRWLRRRPRG